MAEVIIALDVPTGADALRLLDRLPEARWAKIGSILMTREGPDLVRALVSRGLRVFLDLKWHDIPHTVAEAVGAARELGVTMATVHTLGGAEMMEAAASRAGTELKLVGVTVLTSHDASSYAGALGRPEVDLLQEVERQAEQAARCGLAGVVCSAREVSVVRRRLGPQAWIVVPGIRRGSDPEADQVRVATAAEAVASGATHLVVGRPILQARDAGAAFRGFLEEAQCVGS
jgi:orotidine-5'-phosphate decarboxylase